MRVTMQTYRPDIFCRKVNVSGKVKEEVIVEAEIKPTLYLEHTSHQLVLMDEYIRLPKNKSCRVLGYLLVPHGKEMLNLSRSLLETFFPAKCAIPLVVHRRSPMHF